MLADIDRAKIVITNYHAFKLRERIEVSKGTRAAIEGWRGETLQALETEGQMIQRVTPKLWELKNVVVLNQEALYCYRERFWFRVGRAVKINFLGMDEDLKGFIAKDQAILRRGRDAKGVAQEIVSVLMNDPATKARMAEIKALHQLIEDEDIPF